MSVPGPDGRPRCRWSLAAPDFLAYHDEEWGFPVTDDRRLFEKLRLDLPVAEENLERLRLTGAPRQEGLTIELRPQATDLLVV